MEDFEDLVVLRGNTEVISLNVLMAFTANGHYLTIAVTRRFFLGLTFFLQLTLKIFQFLRPTAKYFCLFTANR